MAIKNTPKIVDLYCGCGGFGLGAELAGFHTVAAIDVDATLQSAYKLNFPNTQVINSDLSNFGKKEWNRILENIKIDGVIGGPPCQGYSRMGAADPSDPRRELLIDYFRHVNLLSPRFFVMENVEGLMDKRNVQQLHRALNILDKKYTVLDPVVIDASQWGAPTRRKRVIVIGFDAKRISPITLADLLPPQSYVTVGDAIKDIREPLEQSKDPLDFKIKLSLINFLNFSALIPLIFISLINGASITLIDIILLSNFTEISLKNFESYKFFNVSFNIMLLNF